MSDTSLRTTSTVDDCPMFPVASTRRLFVVLLAAMSGLTIFVAVTPSPSASERTIDRLLHAAPGSASFEIGRAVSFVGSTAVVVVASVMLSAAVWLSSHRRNLALLCLAGPALAGIGQLALKQNVGRTRPATHVLTGASGYAFPSGHTSGAAALAVVVVLLVRLLIFDTRTRRVLVVAASIYAVAVGISRVVVGAHYGLDVVGGWLFGPAAALLAFVALTRTTGRGETPSEPLDDRRRVRIDESAPYATPRQGTATPQTDR